MEARFKDVVERLIARETGETVAIRAATPAGGGCINNAQVLDLVDGRRYFLKSNPHPLPGMFPREAEGLEALAKAGTIRVPKPVGVGGGETGIPPFIVMEYIEQGREKSGFQAIMGRQFAQLHRKAQSPRHGWNDPNYLGSTPQPNLWNTDWVEFWRENRLGHQLRLAERNGFSDTSFRRWGENLMDRLDELIGEPREPACLLHGDLWSGNYLADSQGEPVLIDPAAYFGRREADLAMTLLFGGFTSDFYRAYEEVWPLEEGSSDRLEIYKLYHLLNHLNLFGSGYKSGCMAILKRFGS